MQFHTSMIMFHVNLQGCRFKICAINFSFLLSCCFFRDCSSHSSMCVCGDDSTCSFQTRDIFSHIYPNVLVKNTVFSPEWEFLKWKWETWWIYLIFTNLAGGLRHHAHQNYGSFPQVFGGQKILDKNFEGLALQMMFRFHFGVNKNVVFSRVPSQSGRGR